MQEYNIIMESSRLNEAV